MRKHWWIPLTAVAATLLLGGAIYGLGRDTAVSSQDNDPNTPAASRKNDKGTLAGSVTDADGEPVVKALVAPEPLDADAPPVPEIGVLTSSDGSYEWKLPAGEYEVTIHLEGDELGGETVTVEPRKTVNGDITVE